MPIDKSARARMRTTQKKWSILYKICKRKNDNRRKKNERKTKGNVSCERKMDKLRKSVTEALPQRLAERFGVSQAKRIQCIMDGRE